MSQLNFALLAQISQQAAVTGDPALAELLREISAYPVSDEAKALESGIQTNLGGVFVPLMLATRSAFYRSFRRPHYLGRRGTSRCRRLHLKLFSRQIPRQRQSCSASTHEYQDHASRLRQ
jgi:hypothetical protein